MYRVGEDIKLENLIGPWRALPRMEGERGGHPTECKSVRVEEEREKQTKYSNRRGKSLGKGAVRVEDKERKVERKGRKMTDRWRK